jgi:sulfur-oxidizing protein SoxX
MRWAWPLFISIMASLALSAHAQTRSESEANGRKIVTDRRHGLCLLCHAGTFAEEPFPGNIAPDLRVLVQGRSAAELKARIANPQAYSPESVMPAYGVPRNDPRVGQRWRNQPILSDQELDDVVAFLITLQEPRP